MAVAMAHYGTRSRSFPKHMLKPYDQRVKATYALMQSFIDFTSKNSITIKNPVQPIKTGWSKRLLHFQSVGRSIRTGFKEITYKRDLKPDTNQVKYPGCQDCITIAANRMRRRWRSTTIMWWKAQSKSQGLHHSPRLVEGDRPAEVEWSNNEQAQKGYADWSGSIPHRRLQGFPRQYEMHHVNSDVKVSSSIQKIRFRKGDWYIPMDQAANRFLIETLAPQAEDSYFAWNYFDAILWTERRLLGLCIWRYGCDLDEERSSLRTGLEQRNSSRYCVCEEWKCAIEFRLPAIALCGAGLFTLPGL